MNLFILDADPVMAAQQVYDSHAVKMPLEGMQMLCTNARILGFEHDSLMKSTHENHPSTLWGRTSANNFAWLVTNTGTLFAEYTRRYGKRHANHNLFDMLLPVFDRCMDKLDSMGKTDLTPFAIAVPDDCKRPCPVESYHLCYERKAKQEIEKLLAYKQELDTYNTLQGKVWSFLSGRKKPRKPSLRFVWHRGERPAWATFETAKHA